MKKGTVMGDYANTILLAWPYPGERALPEPLRDLLSAESWLPDVDEPAADIEENYSVVLAGDDSSGPILAISDTEANEGTGRFSDLIAALTDAGMSVYAANQAGDNYAAWNVYHLVDDDGDVSEQHRGMVDGTIILSADDITGPDEYVGKLHDHDVAERTRRLLEHPPGVPGAVRALAWATGPRVPGDHGREG